MTTTPTTAIPKVENWAYPFKAKGGQHVTDPRLYQQALAHARSGTYLLGSNGLWHGGVHFDEGTAAYLDQSRIHCIADGEVVAYRIDDKVHRFAPEEDLAPEGKTYSTSFVLVRHRLEAPRLPDNPEVPPSLVFFSLYMHLLDWAGYEANPALPRPAFWGKDRFRVHTQGGKLNVRQKPSSQALVQAELNNGSQVRILGTGDWCQLIEILDNGLRPLPGRAQVDLGYVARRYLKPEAAPKAQNSVVVLDHPFPIKAGELLGHPGLYEGQQQIHLETFSCDDLPAFIERSRAWATRLPESEKTLLKIHAGASKLITHRPNIDASHPPKISDPGLQVGVDLILSQAQLDALPSADKIVVPARTEGAIRTPEQRWWHLKGLLADSEGKPIEGWLCEQEFITSRHSPWEWLGYKSIEENSTLKSQLAYHLSHKNQLTKAEESQYRCEIDKFQNSSLVIFLTKLISNEKIVQATSDEIAKLSRCQCRTQKPNRLLVKFESEWIGHLERWKQLDELMGHSSEAENEQWAREKERISKLVFSKDFYESVERADAGAIWHIHPIELTANYLSVSNKIIWIAKVERLFGPGVAMQFKQKVIEVSERLGIDPNYIMACIALETGERFDPRIKNPRSTATGLIQFMESTAKALGTTTAELSKMSHVQQMDYVEQYFVMTARNVKVPTHEWSLADLYFAIFTPSLIKMPAGSALYKKGQKAYEDNLFHDRDKDRVISKEEIAANISIFYTKGKIYAK